MRNEEEEAAFRPPSPPDASSPGCCRDDKRQHERRLGAHVSDSLGWLAMGSGTQVTAADVSALFCVLFRQQSA
jgi:hypothetical protein